MWQKLATPGKPGIRTSLIEGFRNHLDTWQNLIKGADKVCDVELIQSAGLISVPPRPKPVVCDECTQAQFVKLQVPEVKQKRNKRRSRVDLSYEVQLYEHAKFEMQLCRFTQDLPIVFHS